MKHIFGGSKTISNLDRSDKKENGRCDGGVLINLSNPEILLVILKPKQIPVN